MIRLKSSFSQVRTCGTRATLLTTAETSVRVRADPVVEIRQGVDHRLDISRIDAT
jgi:hypothetical protein